MPIADLTDVRMHYEVYGTGQPVVLIPGLGVTSEIWRTSADFLSESFSVICPDNRGIGRSSAKRQPRTVRDYSADLLELFDHLQLERAHVMGLSLGGVIAQCFAVEHPDRIHRLVIVAATHDFTPYLREMSRLVGHTLHWFPKSMFERTFEILGAGPPCFDANPGRIDERILLTRKMGVPARAIGRQMHALASSRFDPNEFHIAAPTLALSGQFDSLIPSCYVRKTAALIRDSRFILIPDAGHNPFIDRPDFVLPLIHAFLTGSEIANDRAERETSQSSALPPRGNAWGSPGRRLSWAGSRDGVRGG